MNTELFANLAGLPVQDPFQDLHAEPRAWPKSLCKSQTLAALRETALPKV